MKKRISILLLLFFCMQLVLFDNAVERAVIEAPNALIFGSLWVRDRSLRRAEKVIIKRPMPSGCQRSSTRAPAAVASYGANDVDHSPSGAAW